MAYTNRFVVTPLLRHVLDATRWTVVNTPMFYSERFRLLVVVKPPFTTNLASVPRLAWWLIPRDDKAIVEPAVFHDWLYFTCGQGELTRRACDRLLSDAMRVAGAPWWKRHVVYWAVRLGGWKPWRAYARRARGVRP